MRLRVVFLLAGFLLAACGFAFRLLTAFLRLLLVGLVGLGLVLQGFVHFLFGLGQGIEPVGGRIERFGQFGIDLVLEIGHLLALLLGLLRQGVSRLLGLLADFRGGLGKLLGRIFRVLAGVLGGCGRLLCRLEVLRHLVGRLDALIDVFTGRGHVLLDCLLRALGILGGRLVLFFKIRGLIGLDAFFLGRGAGIFGDLVFGLGGLFQFFRGGGQLVDLVLHFLLLGLFGRLRLLAGRFGLLGRMFGRLEIERRFVFMGQRLGLLLLEEIGGGLFGLVLGLLQGRLRILLGLGAEFADLLGQVSLLLGQLLGRFRLKRLLRAFRADFFLLFHRLGDLFGQRFGFHRLLQAADFLQQGLQGLDGRLLAGLGSDEFAVMQARLGLGQQFIDLQLFGRLHGVGRLSSHVAAEMARFLQALLELAVARRHVALVFQGRQVGVLAAVGRQLRQGLRGSHHLGLVLDKLPDLPGQFGDL